MPKPLFFKLSEEKQHLILEAAFDEFSSHEFREASINQIIKRCHISRGSFYQYFEDKESIYRYLITRMMKEQFGEIWQTYQAREVQDVVAFYHEMLRNYLQLTRDERYRSFFTNVQLSMDYRLYTALENATLKMREECFTHARACMSEEECYIFKELTSVISLIIRELLFLTVSGKITIEQADAIFMRRVEILELSEKLERVCGDALKMRR